MRRCNECCADVEGTWTHCPLCGSALAGEATRPAIPPIPLRFNRQRVFKALFVSSIVVILGSFVAMFLLRRTLDDVGIVRSVWLGVSAMWLVVVMAARKRRNLAKGTVYLVVLLSLVSVYWDYLTGWHAWSVTYAVPIICASAVVAIQILVRLMRIEVGDYIVYSGLTALLGLTPIVFWAAGWITHPLPSLICVVLSLGTLVPLQLARIAETRHELAKRLNM
ncbi:MAG: DUF6320 domain-containing protein [Ruaniaceae bacterium]|nr:DUF6320 domain-containing protein [Ruaniaceae bacterium]